MWIVKTANMDAKGLTSQKEQTAAMAELIADLRKMINNPEYSDVDFVCQDRVRVHGCRHFLTARSPVLKRMLVPGTRELPLPDISSTVLLSLLEYLYTGTMVEYAPLNSRKAYEVITGARYFQLQHVDKLTREFLVNSTATVGDDLTKAALRLSVALEFGTLSSELEILSIEFVRVLNSKNMEPVHLQALSEKAFRYFLHKTKSKSELGTLSFGEYLRFRQIILWCASQVCPEEAADVVNLSLPDSKGALMFLRDSSKAPATDEAQWSYLRSILLRKEDPGNPMASLLSLVDLRRIHPELLMKVVEPLHLVPPADVLKAYQFQALERPRMFAKDSVCTWEHGTAYKTIGDGSTLQKVEAEIGFARATIAIFRPFGIYEWDIIIEQLCHQFCEIGFHFVSRLQSGKINFNGSTLAQQPTGWALNMDITEGTRINFRGGEGTPIWVPYEKDFGHVNARIRVQLDLYERVCSFSVDGDEFQLAWSHLLDGIYFPAVSLGKGNEGRVRIELVSGFDLL